MRHHADNTYRAGNSRPFISSGTAFGKYLTGSHLLTFPINLTLSNIEHTR